MIEALGYPLGEFGELLTPILADNQLAMDAGGAEGAC